jgi:hypothetical protein
MAPKKRRVKVSLLVIKSLVVVLAVYFLFRHKALFFLLAFELLQIWKISIKDSHDVSIDLVFIFGVAGAYYYHVFVGLAVFVLGVINRASINKLEARHIYKAGRILPLIVTASFLLQYSFFPMAVALLLINYVLKYLVDAIVYGCIDLEKTHYHAINIFLSLVMFFFIELIYRTLPILH